MFCLVLSSFKRHTLYSLVTLDPFVILVFPMHVISLQRAFSNARD